MPFKRVHVLVIQGGVLAASCVVAGALSTREDWTDPQVLAALAVLAVGGRLVPITVRVVNLSTSHVGLTLTMALAGPAPAVAVGIVAVGVEALLARPPRDRALAELVATVVVALAGGAVLQGIGVAGEPHGTATDIAAIALAYLLVTAATAALTTLQLRRLGHDTPPVLEVLRTALVDVAPWQLAGAAACGLVLHLDARVGTSAVNFAVAALATLQLLGRAAAMAVRGQEQIALRLSELERLHEGLVATTLRALALRDPSTARHSAVVARLARDLAVQVGLGSDEQALAHTAGLVHDIGKLSFDDAVLAARCPLTAQQRDHVRRHPVDGGRILRGVTGYEEVAGIVEAHHERWDGRGYPHGLEGEEIPRVARLLALAEAYDAMTAADSYRTPLSHEEAIEELWRGAGTQFEPGLVEAFEAVAGPVVEGHAVRRRARQPRSAWA